MVSKYLLPLAALGALLFAVYHVVTAQQVKPKLAPPVEPSRNPFGKGVAGARRRAARARAASPTGRSSMRNSRARWIRLRNQDSGALLAAESSNRNFSAQATSGRNSN